MKLLKLEKSSPADYYDPFNKFLINLSLNAKIEIFLSNFLSELFLIFISLYVNVNVKNIAGVELFLRTFLFKIDRRGLK